MELKSLGYLSWYTMPFGWVFNDEFEAKEQRIFIWWRTHIGTSFRPFTSTATLRYQKSSWMPSGQTRRKDNAVGASQWKNEWKLMWGDLFQVSSFLSLSIPAKTQLPWPSLVFVYDYTHRQRPGAPPSHRPNAFPTSLPKAICPNECSRTMPRWSSERRNENGKSANAWIVMRETCWQKKPAKILSAYWYVCRSELTKTQFSWYKKHVCQSATFCYQVGQVDLSNLRLLLPLCRHLKHQLGLEIAGPRIGKPSALINWQMLQSTGERWDRYW